MVEAFWFVRIANLKGLCSIHPRKASLNLKFSVNFLVLLHFTWSYQQIVRIWFLLGLDKSLGLSLGGLGTHHFLALRLAIFRLKCWPVNFRYPDRVWSHHRPKKIVLLVSGHKCLAFICWNHAHVKVGAKSIRTCAGTSLHTQSGNHRSIEKLQ